jgi:ubiquinone/menaquinone biosynthesis C-methylase UbiE
MTAYSPKEYWTGLAKGILSADAAGFAPVLHPGAPAWFNQAIDTLQFRAVRRALALAALPSGARILDVGCGTGRWLRRYSAIGYRVTGVDATPAMLLLARHLGTAVPLIAGEAHCLPFADAIFDCVSDITVVQHIPTSLQPPALGEMLRVVKPGGRLILMELIRGKGVHIFPRVPQDWIQQATLHGAKLIYWFGQEFLLLDRMFTHAAQTIVGRDGSRARDQAQSLASVSHRATAKRRVYWALRCLTAPLSAWAEPLTEKICSPALATHGVFIFQK